MLLVNEGNDTDFDSQRNAGAAHAGGDVHVERGCLRNCSGLCYHRQRFYRIYHGIHIP